MTPWGESLPFLVPAPGTGMIALMLVRLVVKLVSMSLSLMPHTRWLFWQTVSNCAWDTSPLAVSRSTGLSAME